MTLSILNQPSMGGAHDHLAPLWGLVSTAYIPSRDLRKNHAGRAFQVVPDLEGTFVVNVVSLY